MSTVRRFDAPFAPTAMILAAGRGERMRPLSDSTPKPLLPVRGRALIEHHLEKLVASGVRHVVINVSYRAERIMAALGDGSRYGCAIEYSVEPEPLESGGGVATAAARFRSEAVLLISADIWSDFDYARLIERVRTVAEGPDCAHLVLVPAGPAARGREFALVDGRLTEGEPRSTLANIAVLARRCLRNWPVGVRFRLLEHYRAWVAAGRVSGELHTGSWVNVTTPEDLRALEQARQ
ncbi:MAG: nucleotidyltransferase family protein [Casimicrobiaceae bacterium]|nr:nucleotidyltransferase family protein [Casimicrobiaceae bacterium]MCX8097476.1 nucleotidyltransferase family protein [Casimicrobiaceae bacterium]MDW8311194.1 nucleotidyltransferase family protein [Burkholderiales bacterium]